MVETRTPVEVTILGVRKGVFGRVFCEITTILFRRQLLTLCFFVCSLILAVFLSMHLGLLDDTVYSKTVSPQVHIFVDTRCTWEHGNVLNWIVDFKGGLLLDQGYLQKGVSGKTYVTCYRVVMNDGDRYPEAVVYQSQVLATTTKFQHMNGAMFFYESRPISSVSCVYEMKLEGNLQTLPCPGVSRITQEIECIYLND